MTHKINIEIKQNGKITDRFSREMLIIPRIDERILIAGEILFVKDVLHEFKGKDTRVSITIGR